MPIWLVRIGEGPLGIGTWFLFAVAGWTFHRIGPLRDDLLYHIESSLSVSVVRG